MEDETLTLTGELLEMDDDEIELDEKLDLGTERSADNEADQLQEDTLGSGETGMITDVRFPASVNQGQEVEVFTDVKNTGTETCEFRVYLKNPAGKTIDKEPDILYKSVKPGETATIKTSTHWDPFWAMPGYDWNLSVELWDIDPLFNDLLDTRHFTVKLGQAKEAGEIVNMQYPVSLKKGQDFDVVATFKNTGTRTSQYRLFLRNPAGKTIDYNLFAVPVKPGYTGTIKLTTGGLTKLGWHMPGYDWNLSLVLFDVDLLSFKDRLDSRTFTIKLRSDGVTPPPAVCVEGEVVGDYICKGGVYVKIVPDEKPCTVEGAYSADGTMICRGGVWVPVGAPDESCTMEGAYSADGTMICSAGAWVPVSVPGTGCPTEGAYSADGTKICRGGVWEDIGEGNGNGVRKYLTVEEANERIRLGLPCYFKCTLPIFDLLPGLPYMQGIPVLPGFAITEKP